MSNLGTRGLIVHVVRGAHPNLYMFIAHIKREEGMVSTTLAQLRRHIYINYTATQENF